MSDIKLFQLKSGQAIELQGDAWLWCYAGG